MILSLVEHKNNIVDTFSKQGLTFALGVAKQCNTELEAVVIGGDTTELSSAVSEFGVTKLHQIQDDAIGSYSPQAWATSIHQLIDETKPEALIAPGSLRGNEVLTLIAGARSLPLSTNSIEVVVADEWEITRNCWAGSLMELSGFDSSLKLITLAPLSIEECRVDKVATEASTFSPTLSEKDSVIKLVKIEETAEDEKSLSKASIVVGGGRGVGSADGFDILNQLAEVLDGVVGGSRVTTNNGWIPHRQQIGLTGTRIAPQLYIACGISGSIQHLSGCKTSKNILVINKDPDAPFFSKAKYGVVGDLHEVVPAIIEAIKKG